MSTEHPYASGWPKVDLDLGDGHTLSWSTYEGERCGGIITHAKSPELIQQQRSAVDAIPDAVDEFCQGSFIIRGSKWNVAYPEHASWEFSGSFECPTLVPSFLCHCGDHGFVQNGKWVRA